MRDDEFKKAVMEDRQGIIMNACILAAVAKYGSDEEIKMAARGDRVSLAYLTGRFAKPLLEFKCMLDPLCVREDGG